MRVALYLRVSTSSQTVENQERELAAVAAARGWQVVATYRDEGISGAKGRDRWPGFDRLWKDAARRKFDVVAAWSVDRLGRSLADVATFMVDLKGYGVGLYLHAQAVDTTTPGGKALLRGWRGVFAEFEREMIPRTCPCRPGSRPRLRRAVRPPDHSSRQGSGHRGRPQGRRWRRQAREASPRRRRDRPEAQGQAGRVGLPSADGGAACRPRPAGPRRLRAASFLPSFDLAPSSQIRRSPFALDDRLRTFPTIPRTSPRASVQFTRCRNKPISVSEKRRRRQDQN